MNDVFKIGGKELVSRLFVGTGKFADYKQIPEVIKASKTQVVTVALRRVDFDNAHDTRAYLHLLNAYARDPMGGGKALNDSVVIRTAMRLRNMSISWWWPATTAASMPSSSPAMPKARSF